MNTCDIRVNMDKLLMYLIISFSQWRMLIISMQVLTPPFTMMQSIPPRVHQMVILEPIPIENVVGRDQFIIKCSASGAPAPKIEWSLNGVKFIKDQPFSMIDGVVRHTLNGDSLKISPISSVKDSGRYRCIATNKMGSVFLEKNIKIRAMGQFDPGARYHDPLRKLYPTVGKKFTITCPPHSTGYGTTHKWGIILENSNTPQFYGSGRPVATAFPHGKKFVYSYVTYDDIKQSRDTDGIRCILANYGVVVGSRKMVLWNIYGEVTERRKPVLIKHMAPQMTAVINSEFSMSCGATGYPLPKVSWQYQGTDVKSRYNNSKELNFEFFRILGGGQVLKIRRVTRYSGGTFKCFATNALGKTWKIGQLAVIYPPKWLTFLPDSVRLPLGNTFTFNCSASGSPVPTYEWYHNGSIIKNSLNRFVKGGLLTIKETQFEYDGIYICLAINPLDTLTMSTYIETKAMKPTFEVPLDDPIYLFRESTMHIECKVIGGPIPKKTWLKNDVPIDVGERLKVLGDGTLEIKNVNQADGGKYTCKAENSQDATESSGTAVILEPTVITHPPQNLSFQVGWPYANIFCGASWDKRLDLRIEWYKGGVKMAKFDDHIYLENRARGPPRILYINNLKITDGGIYTCHAYTKVGDVISEERRSAFLRIKGPPEPPAGLTVKGDCSSYDATLTWSRGQELGAETRRFYIEFATNVTVQNGVWFQGNKLKEVLSTGPGTINFYNLDKNNLPPGANLTFRVRAASDHLVGRASRPTQFGLCITPPARPIINPRNVSELVLGTGLFAIQWQPITDVHYGAPGFFYEIGYRRNDTQNLEYKKTKIYDPSVRSFNVPDPGINEGFSFYVRSGNSMGYGPESEIHTGYSGKIKPQEAPKQLNVELVLRFSVELSWQPIKWADGYRISYWNVTDSESQRGHTPSFLKRRKRREVFEEEYDVKYQYFHGNDFRNGAPLTNITADQEFMATVAAFNSGGTGPESNVVEFATSQRVPGRPLNVKLQIFGNSAKLSWHPPLDPNGYIEEYNIFWYKIDPKDRGKTSPTQMQGYLRRQREAYLIKTFDPMEYYNIKLSARNRMGRGQEWQKILVAVSADDIPGKPDTPSVRPFDDTSLNVTFRMSSYGGLPSKFRVLVREKGQYYQDHVIYEQQFPKRAWVLVSNLRHVVYDILTVGINELGQSETSDVAEQRPIRRPKEQAHASGIPWWKSNWFILISMCLLFMFLLTVALGIALRKPVVILYLRYEDEEKLYEEYLLQQKQEEIHSTKTRSTAMQIDPYNTDNIEHINVPPAYQSKESIVDSRQIRVNVHRSDFRVNEGDDVTMSENKKSTTSRSTYSQETSQSDGSTENEESGSSQSDDSSGDESTIEKKFSSEDDGMSDDDATENQTML